MAKKKKQPPAPQWPAESRAVEAATVSWMLATITVLVCSSVGAAVWLFARQNAENASVLRFAHFLHFCAIVAAVVSLGLAAVVVTTRKTPPPRAVTIVAISVALLPLLALLL